MSKQKTCRHIIFKLWKAEIWKEAREKNKQASQPWPYGQKS